MKTPLEKKADEKMKPANKEFLIKLRRKNTLEVAHMLAQEFTGSFGEAWGTKEEIIGKMVPRGKAPSWTMLDRNINVFCRKFYDTWEENEDKISFFDKIRFELYELPMKWGYKTGEREEASLNPEKLAENFTTCSLCWRSVLQKPREKRTALCHLHDIPSSFPEYRRRSRMKKQVEAIRLKLLKSLPALTKLKFEESINLDEYVKSLCLSEQNPLTQLTKYLQSQMDEIDNKINTSNCSNPSNRPIPPNHSAPSTLPNHSMLPNLSPSSAKDILQALEHPIYFSNMPAPIVEAWKLHIEDRTKHFRLNYLRFLTAEAWLRAESERKHGGKRR